MDRKIRDVMTADPISLDVSTTLVDAARAMRDADVGPVLVSRDRSIVGIVTDRDIVVRGVADGKDPATTRLGDISSTKLATLSPDAGVEEAVELMRKYAVRRLPVVGEDGDPVGIISMGDLAVERDPKSALASVSAAPPNR